MERGTNDIPAAVCGRSRSRTAEAPSRASVLGASWTCEFSQRDVEAPGLDLRGAGTEATQQAAKLEAVKGCFF